MLEILAVFGLFHWIVLFILCGFAMFILEATERGATFLAVMFAVYMVFLHYTVHSVPIMWIFAQPWSIVFIPVYVVIGVVWGLFKLRRHFMVIRKDYEKNVAVFMKEHGVTDRDAVASHPQFNFSSASEYRDINTVNKDRVIGWMMFWPLSMTVSLIKDFVVDLWEYMYELVLNQIIRMKERILGQMLADQKVAKQRERNERGR